MSGIGGGVQKQAGDGQSFFDILSVISNPEEYANRLKALNAAKDASDRSLANLASAQADLAAGQRKLAEDMAALEKDRSDYLRNAAATKKQQEDTAVNLQKSATKWAELDAELKTAQSKLAADQQAFAKSASDKKVELDSRESALAVAEKAIQDHLNEASTLKKTYSDKLAKIKSLAE